MVLMPSIDLNEDFLMGPTLVWKSGEIDPKKQALGLRTGDRMCFSLSENNYIKQFREGQSISEMDFDFNELLVRCKKGMSYLRHKYSFVPILDEKKLHYFLTAIDQQVDCILIRFKSL